MTAPGILHDLGERLGSAATVKTVFGEPIHAQGKTVVPVARVAFGFGAGSGSGARRRGEHDSEGGGGGGGARAYPVGALEITADRTKFIPFVRLHWLPAVLAVGFWLGRRGFRHVSRS